MQVLSEVPLHCSLGTGLKLINSVGALCKKFDLEWMREAGDDTAQLAEDVETLEIEIVELEGELESLEASAGVIQGEINFCDQMSPGIFMKRGGLGKDPSQWLIKVCAMPRHGTPPCHAMSRHPASGARCKVTPKGS